VGFPCWQLQPKNQTKINQRTLKVIENKSSSGSNNSDILSPRLDSKTFRPRARLIHKDSKRQGINIATNLFVFDSIPNFRDIGGCFTENGQRVPFYMLYRSAAPVTGSEKDIKHLMEEIKIQRAIDLRSTDTHLPNELSSPYHLLFPKEKTVAMDMTCFQFRLKNSILVSTETMYIIEY